MKPRIKIFRNGAWQVDAGQLLTSETVRKDLQSVRRLYERLKKEGYDVRSVTRRREGE